MFQSFSNPTALEPWYSTSATQLCRNSYWNPLDQFMMYGIRILGSNQETPRALKLAPMKGVLPSGAILNRTGGGPCERKKADLGSPAGGCRLAVARYSSKFWLMPLVSKSAVIRPKFPRNTNRGLKLKARPNGGWKLFKSRLASKPVPCTIAPRRPVIGSIAAGSNWDCWPYLVDMGDS